MPRAEAKVSTPALLKLEVAVPPKYAVPVLEKSVEEAALGKMTRFGKESVTLPVPALAVIWFAVPARLVTPVLVTVRPEPMMDCPPVTERPAPEETVPVAADCTAPLPAPYKRL